MDVINIIDPKIVDTRLNVNNKSEVVTKLAQDLFTNGYIDDVSAFVDDVYLRELEGQTGIGGYIAIPHSKSKHVKKLVWRLELTRRKYHGKHLMEKG